MIRQFTIQCIQISQFITISIENLNSLKIEFPEIYEDIFEDNKRNLYMTLELKGRAHMLLENIGNGSNLSFERSSSNEEDKEATA